MRAVLTIGVYGWSGNAWIRALKNAGCDALVDIRARRGVRGSAFTFANSTRLQVLLEEANIRYYHRPELAPSQAVRDSQTSTDHESATLKRDRTSLTPAFVRGYEAETEGVDWTALAVDLNADRPCLLCVERVPAACHRSIAARHLAGACSVAVEDLVP
jgi:uncharacterized protein (DUF488 family)